MRGARFGSGVTAAAKPLMLNMTQDEQQDQPDKSHDNWLVGLSEARLSGKSFLDYDDAGE